MSLSDSLAHIGAVKYSCLSVPQNKLLETAGTGHFTGWMASLSFTQITASKQWRINGLSFYRRQDAWLAPKPTVSMHLRQMSGYNHSVDPEKVQTYCTLVKIWRKIINFCGKAHHKIIKSGCSQIICKESHFSVLGKAMVGGLSSC